jgi:hypothetical protein
VLKYIYYNSKLRVPELSIGFLPLAFLEKKNPAPDPSD